MPAPRRWRIERDATRTPSTSSSSTQVAHPRIAPGSGRRAEWKLAHLAVGVALHIDRAAATRAVERYRCSLCASRSIELSPTKFRLSRGNTEGTPARARTSMRDHSLWPNSSALRAFLVRRRPRLPSPPAPVLNGKEGSTVRVRQRALNSPQNGGFCCLIWYNRDAPAGRAALVPGGLDQEPAYIAVAGLGDSALAAPLPA
jgi:hypothetical protein